MAALLRLHTIALSLSLLAVTTDVAFAQDATSPPVEVAPPAMQPSTGTVAGQVSEELFDIVKRRLDPKTLELIELAAALRNIANPNFRQALARQLASSDLSYIGTMLNLGSLYRGSIVRGQLDATMLADSLGAGSANVLGAIAWDLPICRVLGASGSIGAARYDDRSQLQGYVEGTACLPLAFSSLELRIGLRKGLRATTVERAIYTQGEFDSFEIGLDVRAFRLLRPRWDVDFWGMGLGVTAFDYAAPAQPTTTTLTLQFAAAAIHRYGRGMAGATQTHEILKAGITTNDQSTATSLGFNFDFYRFDNVRLGKHVALALGGGLARAIAGDPRDTSKPSNGLIAPGGMFALTFGDAARFAETRFSSYAQAGNLSATLEQRVTQRFVEQSQNLILDAQGWVGRSALVSVVDTRKVGLVWGATGTATVPLWQGLRGYLQLEVSQVVLPDNVEQTGVAKRGILGVAYSLGKDFVNHRKPVQDPQWLGR